MKKHFSVVLISFAFILSSRAVVPEPDNVLYGLVYAGSNQLSQITAANTNVVIEARRTPAGAALASYAMGSRLVLGDYYALRLSLESVQPITSPQAFQPGETAYLTVVDPSGVVGQQTVVVGQRGQIVRFDFGLSGFPANWLAYLRHPADNAPADNTISFSELDAYSTAWKNGQAWPVGPNPIPIGYAARAGTLWLAGGNYVFDPSQVLSAPTNSSSWWATNAPLWWANSVPAIPPPMGNSVVRLVSPVYTPAVPLQVTNVVTVSAGIGVYAVEDQPPAGWLVTSISDAGTFDPVNQKVKWGLFFDNTPRALTYTLTPPANATGDGPFGGQGSFDGQLVAIGGDVETGPPGPGAVALTSVGFSHSTGFRLKLQGAPGDGQLVEISTNLVEWSVLTNITLDSQGFGDLIDPAATNSPTRFYRTKAQD